VSEAVARLTLSEQTVRGIREVLDGRRRGPSAALLFAGPAVIASIAYMDPGNFATNIQAGARYGYALLWVVLMANLIAMLFQALSAKLGIVTGRNLAEMCREHAPRPAAYAMWAASEVAAMATDLAEFLGGAIGLSLLFGLPLLVGMAVTGLVTYGILLFERHGFRPIELIIGALVGAIGICYLVEVFIAPVAWGQAGLHIVLPWLPDAAALTLSVGIIGATVMPHALYLPRRVLPANAASCCASPTVRFSLPSQSPAWSTWRWSPWRLPHSAGVTARWPKSRRRTTA
jgi:manganese transport protein